MSVTTAPIERAKIGWLRGQSFDLFFIAGITALALGAGATAVAWPFLFPALVFADLWFLGYHHVVATYTRLCFDRESFREHAFLILVLPVLVILAVLALVGVIGFWTLATVYLYWQWYHYTRQSWGIGQVYRRKSGGLTDENPTLAKLTFWAVPVWGILNRSWQDPGMFLGLQLRVIPVPEIAVQLAGLAAAGLLAWWVVTRFALWREGRLPVAHTLYMVSHFAVFYVGYVVINDISVGWLVANVWHNAQYIAFVWLFNNNRFKQGVEPKARFLSSLSQTSNAWKYLAVCFGISTTVYLALAGTIQTLPYLVVAYQIINFHHYIVDSRIWKVRRPKLQKTLGLTA